MPLSTVVNGATISHLDLDQAINVLQQPSGGQEKGKYHLAGNSYVSGGFISLYEESLSRNSVPVSVSIDTADTAPTNINAPAALKLTANGFQVHATSTGIVTSANAAGNHTLQY